MDAPDPNAYATGAQAASVNARSAFEEHDVDHARKRREFAAEALLAAKQRLHELEAAYKLGQIAFDEAAQYDQLAARQLEASLARLAKVRAPLHPVRKTPLELLGLIFECCWDPLPASSLLSENPVYVLRRQRQPFQLAAVCRRWRRASLLCPKAWSCIELCLDVIPKNSGGSWAAYLSCMLNRSAFVSLHLRITRSRSSQSRDSELIKPLVDQMARCESLLLSATRICDANDTLVTFLTTATPALCTLHLLVPADRAFIQQMAVLPSAPKLTRVRTSFPFAHAQAQLPTVTFAALYGPVTSDTDDDLGAALSVCPKLHTISLFDSFVAGSSVTPPLPRIISNNAELFIRLNNPSVDRIAFSDRFSFPRLTYLFLYGPQEAGAARVHLLHSLLIDAAPALTRVRMAHLTEADVEPLTRSLRPAAKLQELELMRTHFDSHGLRRICEAFGSASKDGAWLCPALIDLNFQKCTFSEDCAVETLAELLERRNRASARVEDPQRPQRLVKLRLPANMDRATTSRISDSLKA